MFLNLSTSLVLKKSIFESYLLGQPVIGVPPGDLHKYKKTDAGGAVSELKDILASCSGIINSALTGNQSTHYT